MQQHQQQSTCQEEHILLLGEADCPLPEPSASEEASMAYVVTATELGTRRDVCSRYFAAVPGAPLRGVTSSIHMAFASCSAWT